MTNPLRASMAVVALVTCLVACGNGDDGPSPSTASSDWPSYGHDLANTRANGAEHVLSPSNVAGLVRRWSVDVHNGVTSTPAVYEGAVYFGSWNGKLRAVDAVNGTAIWTADLSDTLLDATPLVTGELVYIGDAHGLFYAVDRVTGASLWTVRLDANAYTHIYSSAALVDDLLLIGVASDEEDALPDNHDYTFRGSMVALEAQTGHERWRFYTTNNDTTSGAGAAIWSSAAVDTRRGLFYVGTGNSYSEPESRLSDAILALRYATGSLAWSHQLTEGDVFPTGPNADVGASPNLFSIDGRDIVGIGSKNGGYAVFDRDTGAAVWTQIVSAGSTLGGIVSSTAYADGVVYVCSNLFTPESGFLDRLINDLHTSVTAALSARDGNVLWLTTAHRPCLGGLAIANGLLFFGTVDGTTHALDVRDGTELWSDQTGLAIGGGLSVSNGIVFVGHLGWEQIFFPDLPMYSGGVVAYGLPPATRTERGQR